MDNECATRLEVEFVVMRRDMGEIKTDQRESRKDMAGIRNILAKLPTSPDGHFNFPHPWPGQIPPAD